MAGSRQPGPICAHSDPVNLRSGLTCLCAPSHPGPVSSQGLIPEGMTDISSRFIFRQWSIDNYSYVQASGELGIPGQVQTHRDKRAQKLVSAGTGEHAGHLIAIQFGAPGDDRNLGLQNPNMNTFAPKKYQEAFLGPGGSYYDLESSWKELLLDGWRIHVTITDKYRRNEDRPFTRNVSWIESSPSGENRSNDLDFGNFGSPQKQAAEA
jgi:hypothetical protein